MSNTLDRLGTFASGACAVHCVVCALAPGVLAALGMGALIGHETEWGFTIGAMLFALAALVVVLRTHRSAMAASLLGVGAAGLLSARFLEESAGHTFGMVIGVASGLALMAGHVTSIRAAKTCRVDCEEACG